jgi:sugar O-acyltransferase (sialic acid O-acetyltransferase NeuD family)
MNKLMKSVVGGGKTLFIYGNAGVGKELAYLLDVTQQARQWDDVVFINDYENGQDVLGHDVISFEESLRYADKGTCEYVIALGEPALRAELYEKCVAHGLKMATVFGGQYPLSDSSNVGEGSIVNLGAILTIQTKIGNNCLLNKSVAIGHNVVIGNHCVISPNSVIGGFTEIGDQTYVGSGVVIRDRIKIGKNCIIGMGSVVTKNVQDCQVVVGNPAKFLRYNETDRVFK